MEKLYLVTSNKNKAHDIQAILGLPIEVVPLHLTEIQDLDLDNIVRFKANQAYSQVKKPLIVEEL